MLEGATGFLRDLVALAKKCPKGDPTEVQIKRILRMSGFGFTKNSATKIIFAVRQMKDPDRGGVHNRLNQLNVAGVYCRLLQGYDFQAHNESNQRSLASIIELETREYYTRTTR